MQALMYSLVSALYLQYFNYSDRKKHLLNTLPIIQIVIVTTILGKTEISFGDITVW